MTGTMVSSPSMPAVELVVKLQGGIGNQFFQLCFGDYLQRGCTGPVSYLTDAFGADPYGRKNIASRLFPDTPLLQMQDIAGHGCRLLQESMLTGHLAPGSLYAMLAAQHINHCLLDGYWQDIAYVSEGAFANINAGLSALASSATSAAFEKHKTRIAQAACAIAVHVRRHDYKHHGICRENYYVDTLHRLLEQAPRSEVMVFSDEPNYTGHFLRQHGIQPHIIATGDDLLDMYLMSRCHMHVISNSTYSWWGAMLAAKRIVVYPLPWSAVHAPSAGFFPAHWFGVDDAVSSAVDPMRFTETLTKLKI